MESNCEWVLWSRLLLFSYLPFSQVRISHFTRLLPFCCGHPLIHKQASVLAGGCCHLGILSCRELWFFSKKQGFFQISFIGPTEPSWLHLHSTHYHLVTEMQTCRLHGGGGGKTLAQWFSNILDSRHPSLDLRHPFITFEIWVALHFTNTFITVLTSGAGQCECELGWGKSQAGTKPKGLCLSPNTSRSLSTHLTASWLRITVAA